MCDVLKLPRSTFYSRAKNNRNKRNDPYTADVIRIFIQNRKNYGTRRIKEALHKDGKTVSRRRISRIMKQNALVSNYTIARYKAHPSGSNEDQMANVLNRDFDGRERLEVVVSDLTYVRVKGKWHYVCLILDLHNREIIGYSAGARKDSALVYRAFASIKHDLSKITILHTDRGHEFKNAAIDSLISTFQITRSLSKKGCPYDNAVAEATFKSFKVEFVYPNIFQSLHHLELALFDYVNWYNNIRLHSSLGYLSPNTYKNIHLKNVV
jgi:transposase InsO family protein